MNSAIFRHGDVLVLQTRVQGKVRRICVSVQAVEQYVAFLPGRRYVGSPRKFVAENRQLLTSAARQILAGTNAAADFISVGAANLQHASELAERRTWFVPLRSPSWMLGLVSKTIRRGISHDGQVVGDVNEPPRVVS